MDNNNPADHNTADPNNPNQLDAQTMKDVNKYHNRDFLTLARQIDYEWNLAWDHQHSKKEEALLRLKLYNNQKRDKEAVGDTTMFTVHQTILASLYTDRLEVEFGAREEGDQDTAENLNHMATFDYDEMEKDLTDYDWDWDTIFFGRGLLLMTEFRRDPKNNLFVPAPEVIDPCTWLRDPRCVAVNGNNSTGKNAMRFGGREIKMSKYAMQNDPKFFKDIDWSEIKYGSGLKSLIDMAAMARADAQGYNQARLSKYGEDKLNDNGEYDILEWYTHWRINGILKKCRVWLANERKKVVGLQVMGDPEKKWAIIDRPLYPTSHDWDGTSVPDLTEDKQRHRAVAQNLGLRAMTADLYPNYIYDQNKIKNRNDLQTGFNKYIPVDGSPDAILPLRKAAPNMQLLDFIWNSLDVSAQKATATPDIQQGIQSQQARPLGETNIVASKTDTRYGLSAKVFGWSERRFWQQWYLSYKENFADHIDEKVLRLSGAFGPKWRVLTKDQIIANVDPDVSVESMNISRAKQLEERQALGVFFGVALSDPNANRRYGLKKLAKLNGMEKDEIDRLFPPTIDEMQAEDENDLLGKDKFVRVLPEQDHHTHLEIHSKAKTGKASMTHIETHKHALSLKRSNPSLFPAPQDQNAAAANPSGQAPGQTGILAGMTGGSGSSAQPAPAPGGGAPGVQPSQTSGQPGGGLPGQTGQLNG